MHDGINLLTSFGHESFFASQKCQPNQAVQPIAFVFTCPPGGLFLAVAFHLDRRLTRLRFKQVTIHVARNRVVMARNPLAQIREHLFLNPAAGLDLPGQEKLIRRRRHVRVTSGLNQHKLARHNKPNQKHGG